jgi:hypothetical protein
VLKIKNISLSYGGLPGKKLGISQYARITRVVLGAEMFVTFT